MTRLAWKVFISSKSCRLIVILRQEFIRHPFGKLLFLLCLWISQFPIKREMVSQTKYSLRWNYCRNYMGNRTLFYQRYFNWDCNCYFRHGVWKRISFSQSRYSKNISDFMDYVCFVNSYCQKSFRNMMHKMLLLQKIVQKPLLKNRRRIFHKFRPFLIIDKVDRALVHMFEIRHVIIIIILTLSVWITPCKPPVCRSNNISVEIPCCFI